MAHFLGFLTILTLGQAAGETPKPLSLIPPVREVDRVVERMQLPVNSFIPGGDRKALDAAIETVKAMPIAVVPHWVSLTPNTVVQNGDTIELVGTFAPQRAKRAFYTDAEAKIIDDFAFQRRKLDENHTKRLDDIRVSCPNMGESYCSTMNKDADFSHQRALDDLAQKEAEALRPGEANANVRGVAYNTIKVIAVAPTELAASIDVAKLAKAKSVKLTILVKSVELSAPIAEAKIPSLLSVLG